LISWPQHLLHRLGRLSPDVTTLCSSPLTAHVCVSYNKLCGRPTQYAPAPVTFELWPFDLESGVPVTCDVGCLCANFSLPRLLCSRLRYT